MASLNCFFRFFLGVFGILIAILAILFLVFGHQAVSNEVFDAGLRGNSWLSKAIVYGIGVFLIILAGLEILSGIFQNKCLICLVSFFLTLV